MRCSRGVAWLCSRTCRVAAAPRGAPACPPWPALPSNRFGPQRAFCPQVLRRFSREEGLPAYQALDLQLYRTAAVYVLDLLRQQVRSHPPPRLAHTLHSLAETAAGRRPLTPARQAYPNQLSHPHPVAKLRYSRSAHRSRLYPGCPLHSTQRHTTERQHAHVPLSPCR